MNYKKITITKHFNEYINNIILNRYESITFYEFLILNK